MAITRDQIESWLKGIAVGVIVLDRDNAAMAKATLSLLADMAKAPLPDDHLSPNFTLTELTYSDTALAEGIDNSAPPDVVAELEQLALVTLEGIRLILGCHPLLISSGYRCPELNVAVGGASNSAHLFGAAADFECPSFGAPLDICRAIEPHLFELQIDQLIHENESWVHVGRAPAGAQPRYECLTIDNGQTVSGIV